MTPQNQREDNMNNPNFDPSKPSITDASTASNRSRGAFSAGMVTGFALCGLLLGGGFVLFQQFTNQFTNQAIVPNSNQSASAQPVPVQSAPMVTSSIPPTAPAGVVPAAQPASTPSTMTSPMPATSVFQTQGSVDEATFTVQLLELKRISGDMLLLRLAITNTGSKDISPGYDFTKEGSWDFNIYAISGVYVVDLSTGQKL